MKQMTTIWVPEATPMNSKPLMYSVTKPEDIGWKPIIVDVDTLAEWRNEPVKDKLLLG